MEKPTVDVPVHSYREHAAFTVAAVAADPEVAGMEQGLLGAHLLLKQEQRAFEDQEEEVQRKLAVFKRNDGACDDVLRDFELHLFALVKKDRDDPRYRRYIKTNLRALTEAEPRKTEPTIVAAIIVSLTEDEQSPSMGTLAQQFRPRFESTLADVQTAEQELSAAEAVMIHMRDQKVVAAKTSWIDEYVKLHGAIRGIFPRDPGRVESYFLRFRKDRKKADEVTNGAAPQPPAPPSPPAPPA